MPHDHVHHSPAPPPTAGTDIVSAFAVSALARLGIALAAAVLLWLAVAWALGWL